MEEMTLVEDIEVVYITADSFPQGILKAHNRLHEVLSVADGRRFFGLSRPENGEIVYKAAAEEMNDREAQILTLDRLVIKKGRYICATVNDFMKDTQSINRTFQQLLACPGLDPEGYCVEWYLNDKDVKCMIRLKE